MTENSKESTTTTGVGLLPPKESFHGVLRRAVIWPLTVLVFALCLLLGLLTYLFATARSADQSNAVLAQISRVEKLAVDMETGVRGYRITADRVFLEPFERADREFGTQLDKLQTLLTADASQLKELSELRGTHALWREFATNVRDRVQTEAPADIAAHIKGKELMDAVRAHIGNLQNHERALLSERARMRGQLRAVTLVATILSGLTIAPMLAFTVRRSLRRAMGTYGAALGTVSGERERLRITLASIGDAVIATDSQGRITYLNPVAAELTGWSVPEAIGQPLMTVFKIINEQSRQPSKSPAEEALREGRAVGLANHTLLITKDGREIPIADSAAPIRDETGAITGVVLVFRDQTAERQAAAKIEWLASFPQKNPNPVIELDLKTGEVAYANAFTEESFPNLKTQGLRHPFLAELQPAASLLVEGKTDVIRREMSVGARCYAQTISFIPEVNRLRVYCSEITETKLIEAKLRQSHDQMRLISDGLPALISYVDTELRYRFCNRAYQDWFELPNDQVIGHTMAEVIGREAWGTVGPRIEEALAGKSIEYEAYVEYRTAPRWIHAVYTPHRDDSGRVLGVLVMVMDVSQQKRAEGALRQSEEKFRQVFEHAAMGVGLTDAEGRIQQVNPPFCALLGYGAEELLGVKVGELVHPDDRAQNLAAMRELREEKKEFYVMESRYVHRNGHPVWVRKFVSTLRDSQGKPTNLVALVTDIRERKQAEILLDSQKQSLEMVVSGAPLGEVLTYLARVVERQSDGKAIASILILGPDGLLHNGASPSLPADYIKAIDGLKPCEHVGTCCAAAATGQVVLTPDINADPKWEGLKHLPLDLGFVAAWSQPITASDGRVLGTFGTYFRERRNPAAFERRTVEILARTAALAIERRRVEDERKLFVSLAENSSDFIGMCDAKFQPFFVNRAGLRMVGLDSAEQARTTPVKEFFFPEDQDRIINKFFPQVLAKGGGEMEIRFRHFKTGAALWMLYNVWVVTDDQGAFAGLATVSRDITDRRRAEDALRQSQTELASANKKLASRADELDDLVERRTVELRETIQQLETFSYSIVHDMRAPLRSMRSFAGFLHQDYTEKLDPQANNYLRRIMESSARMDALITDVLTYSRVSRGATDLAPVDLDRLVPEIVEQYPHLQEKMKAIHISRPLPTVRGNPALLTQVFSNLLGNALKFVPDGREPRISVRAENNHSHVRIWVEDNGIGVPEHHRERIFGLFQRLHRVDEYGGTGVGLAIVKRAVERMGGTVGVESEGEKGSRFWIELSLS